MNKKRLSIAELTDAVELDEKNSTTKRAAELLITAMHDWPTSNLSDVFEFLREFKNDYGNHLTMDDLKRKIMPEAWKEEAKQPVIEMLQLNASQEFDWIIGEVLRKYARE
jgi:hypothetical protein